MRNGANGGAGDAGRDEHGRFSKGNQAARGRSHSNEATKARALRAALLDAAEADHVVRIYRALVAEAEKGNVLAAREVFDRLLGKPTEIDLLEDMARLKESLGVED